MTQEPTTEELIDTLNWLIKFVEKTIYPHEYEHLICIEKRMRQLSEENMRLREVLENIKVQATEWDVAQLALEALSPTTPNDTKETAE